MKAVLQPIAIFSLLYALAGAVCYAQAPAATPLRPAPGWVDPHRHFQFDGIVFDLDYGAWSYAIWGGQLRDCSTERMHCLSSETFSVVLPRRCADLAAGHWAVGDIRTDVLLRHTDWPPPIHGPGSGVKLYLGSSARPNLLFVYDFAIGIDALYWDQGGRIDFIALAREGRLEDWLSSEAARPTQGRYFTRTSFQAIGACRE